MASLTDRFITAVRSWASENGRADYDLVHWAQLYLGWPYRNVGVNPNLEEMAPVQRARRSVGEHVGHPTLDQLEDRIHKLLGQGMWEPFLVSSLARCIADELERLAEAEAIARTRVQRHAELDAFAADPEARAKWVTEVRKEQVGEGIPLDDLATDSSVDAFVESIKSKLQPLTEEEAAERRRQADSWRRLAGDLMDFTAESGRALGQGE